MPTISYETIIWVVRNSIFAMITIVILSLTSSTLIMNINVQDVESEIFISRVIYSENINYVDENGRVHSGVIDMNNFYPENLEKEFVYPEERALAAKLTLYEAGKSQGNDLYYNKEWYVNWEPLIGSEGKGGVTSVQRTAQVLIMEGGNLKNGVLEVNVITQNT